MVWSKFVFEEFLLLGILRKEDWCLCLDVGINGIKNWCSLVFWIVVGWIRMDYYKIEKSVIICDIGVVCVFIFDGRRFGIKINFFKM